jgi:site-specific recombinase XerD
LNYHIVKKYARLAKVAGVTPHVFRHTCATHMLKGRAGIRHIQELLGHRCLATTQRYTRLEITDLKQEHRRCHPRERTK